MDPEVEEHYKDLLRQWRKDDDDIKDKLDTLEKEVINCRKMVCDLKDQVAACKGK